MTAGALHWPAARVPVETADAYLSMLEDLCAALDSYIGPDNMPAEVRALWDEADAMLQEAPLKDDRS